jgi:prophage maintenance system killer protein
MARSVRQLTVADVERTAYQMAVELKWKEPIPPVETRYPGKLEGALGAPFQTFQGKPIYRGVPAKAAALFYFLVKSHPFQNGNKRIALASLFVYLSRNGYWLKISPDELYEVAVWVAGSPRTAQAEAVKFLRRVIVKYRTRLTD